MSLNMKKSKNIIIVLILIIISIAILFGLDMLRKAPPEPESGVFTKNGLLYKSGSDKPFTGKVKDSVANNVMVYDVVNGIKFGRFELYTNGDHLTISGELENNENTGEWTYYYPSGKIESRGGFEDNILAGKWTWYYKDGTIKEEGFYIKGEREGKWVTYNENGIIQSQVTFEKGKAICEIKNERFIST
jgi:antitoxin component YwqK of YwqJK toxin-antitoxin module